MSLLLFFSNNSLRADSEYSALIVSTPFSVYCTSNFDDTGSCTRTDNNQPIDCVLIPGGVITCKQDGVPPIQCILYGSVIDTQGYFYCTRRTSPGMTNSRINTNRFAAPLITPFTPPPSHLSPQQDSDHGGSSRVLQDPLIDSFN